MGLVSAQMGNFQGKANEGGKGWFRNWWLCPNSPAVALKLPNSQGLAAT